MSGDEPVSPSKPHTVTLPLTFHNSFYTANPRDGFTVLYDRLESGIVESQELLATIRQRADSERSMSELLYPSALAQNGFGRDVIDEGASLKLAYESLLSSTVAEAKARRHLSVELERTIAGPFEDWSNSHAGRIRSSRSLVESHLQPYEKKFVEVVRLKAHYDDSCRSADSYEDEIAFLKGQPAPQRQRAPSMSRESSTSDAGIDDLDDDTIIPRSGATGSLTAALGRALTIRPRKASGSTSDPASQRDGMTSPHNETVGVALDWSKTTINHLMDRVTGPQTIEAKFEKARREADLAEEKYKQAVEVLDILRLRLEECLAQHYAYVHRCELDRLRAAASVLKSFHTSIASLPKALAASVERAKGALDLVQPEKDIAQTVERLRTGPFQPCPVTFQSHYSEPPIQNFGMRLQHWAETASSDSVVPPILTLMLDQVKAKYPAVSDDEKRKSWLYETPLQAQHTLRAALNDVAHVNESALAKADLPIACSVVKLWLLELDVPVIVFSQYEEYRTLYPKRVGAEVVEVPSKIIADHIARLPPVHLEILRRVIGHFSQLLEGTKTKEPRDVYLQKLSLSVSRCIIRPKHDTPLTHDDRFPQLLFIDLVNRCAEIFKYADELKAAQRDDRYKPRRQRTKLVDQRISRSRLGVAQNEAVDPDRSVEIRKEQLASPPSVQGSAGQLAVAQQQAYSASPMDMHAPELPSPSKVSSSQPVSTEQPAEQQPSSPKEQFEDASQTVAPTTDDEGATPTRPQAAAADSGAVESEEKANADEPIQASKGSLSRSTRVRGARGPRPISGVGTGAGGPATTASPDHNRSHSFNKARQMFEHSNE